MNGPGRSAARFSLSDRGRTPASSSAATARSTCDAVWRFQPQWQLEAKVLNVLDHRVEPVLDYQGLGRRPGSASASRARAFDRSARTRVRAMKTPAPRRSCLLLASAAAPGRRRPGDRSVTIAASRSRCRRRRGRIVSLLPSLTETVCALGACARLVGTDRFSNLAGERRGRCRSSAGSTTRRSSRIVSLHPDVVLRLELGARDRPAGGPRSEGHRARVAQPRRRQADADAARPSCSKCRRQPTQRLGSRSSADPRAAQQRARRRARQARLLRGRWHALCGGRQLVHRPDAGALAWATRFRRSSALSRS